MIVIQRSSGTIQRTYVQGEVISSETVKTPAGEFSTFRLRLSLGGAPVTEWWYAPEIGAPVRRRALDEGAGAPVSELVGYGH